MIGTDIRLRRGKRLLASPCLSVRVSACISPAIPMDGFPWYLTLGYFIENLLRKLVKNFGHFRTKVIFIVAGDINSPLSHCLRVKYYQPVANSCRNYKMFRAEQWRERIVAFPWQCVLYSYCLTCRSAIWGKNWVSVGTLFSSWTILRCHCCRRKIRVYWAVRLAEEV